MFSHPPFCFKVSLPKGESIIFGEKPAMFFMFIDGKTVLHAVDTATHFSFGSLVDAHAAN